MGVEIYLGLEEGVDLAVEFAAMPDLIFRGPSPLRKELLGYEFLNNNSDRTNFISFFPAWLQPNFLLSHVCPAVPDLQMIVTANLASKILRPLAQLQIS